MLTPTPITVPQVSVKLPMVAMAPRPIDDAMAAPIPGATTISATDSTAPRIPSPPPCSTGMAIIWSPAVMVRLAQASRGTTWPFTDTTSSVP